MFEKGLLTESLYCDLTSLIGAGRHVPFILFWSHLNCIELYDQEMKEIFFFQFSLEIKRWKKCFFPRSWDGEICLLVGENAKEEWENWNKVWQTGPESWEINHWWMGRIKRKETWRVTEQLYGMIPDGHEVWGKYTESTGLVIPGWTLMLNCLSSRWLLESQWWPKPVVQLKGADWGSPSWSFR